MQVWTRANNTIITAPDERIVAQRSHMTMLIFRHKSACSCCTLSAELESICVGDALIFAKSIAARACK